MFNSISYRIGGFLIDPGDEWYGFMNIEAILLTHAHLDHIYGLNRLLELNSDATVYTNEQGCGMLFDDKKNMSRYHETPFVFEHPERVVIVNDGDEINIGEGMTATAIFTPGHNPSCITWIVGNNLFTGDSYIPGVKTVTNLPGSNKLQAAASERLLFQLAKDYIIFPGHSIMVNKSN